MMQEMTGLELPLMLKRFPKEAFNAALKQIRSYRTDRFIPTDIECLVDEEGKYHHPDVFLK